MSNLLFAHHITLPEISEGHYESLYKVKRRDSHFAGAVQKGNKIHAFRDHLGIVPLYYRYTDTGIRFSMNFNHLIEANDTLIPAGFDIFSKFATVRFAQLFEQIHIVPPASVIEIDPITQRFKIIYQYEFQPRNIPITSAWDSLVDEFKRLMLEALQQTIQYDTVGLYLSGGIDSAMIAILLKELGVTVNGYTSGPWGEAGSDIEYAKRNAQITNIARHEFDFLDTSDYPRMMDKTLTLFQLPKGIPTVLGVASLWDNTSIGTEKQLFFGQNCDNIMGSMTAQYLTMMLQPFPSTIRQRIHPALCHSDMLKNYLHLAKNFSGDHAELSILQSSSDMSQMEKLIVAAMGTVGNSSSEVFTQPAFTQGIMINNPYHNVDLVEFVMGLPLRFRLSFTKRRGIPIPVTEKHLIQKLAERYLPASMTKRKKAFTVSFDRDDVTRRLYEDLPEEFIGVSLDNENEKFSGAMLQRWIKQVGVKI